MTIVRWILWISVGGAALWLYQRFFGGELPEGLVTGALDTDRSSQIGERGTGIAGDARVASWRTTFTGMEENPDAAAWFSSWSRSTPGGLPGTAGNGESDTTLETFVTLGESCSPPGVIALGPLTYLTTGGTSQVIAQCKNGYGSYTWIKIGTQNKD